MSTHHLGEKRENPTDMTVHNRYERKEEKKKKPGKKPKTKKRKS